MRWLVFLLFFPLCSSAQLLLVDDFSDGDFRHNPSWRGDTAYFTINSALELQLQDTAANSRYLAVASNISLEATWQFDLRFDFNPSASNYARIYLISDKPNLDGPLQGYFVRVGGSSSDRISLFRQDGQSLQLLCESGDDWVDDNTVSLRIRVKRQAHLFTLEADTGQVTSFSLLGSALDSSYLRSGFFGLRCFYTLTRADRFYFDNFQLQGDPYIDSLPPQLLAVETLDSLRLRLRFSEALDSASAEDSTRYFVSGHGLPHTAQLAPLSNDQLLLTFPNPFPPNTVLQLQVLGVEDRWGNSFSGVFPFYYFLARWGQLIINELMPDPSPVVGLPPEVLPEEEYIELYNRSNLTLDLEGWQMQVGPDSFSLPPLKLLPDKHLLLCAKSAAALFPDSLAAKGIDLSRSALNNSGEELRLFAPEGSLVDHIHYSKEYYGDGNKSEGGWSLERIDPDNLCGGLDNWRAADDPLGGTPGGVNSVRAHNPDLDPPRLLSSTMSSDSLIELHFSEAIFGSFLLDANNYEIVPPLSVRKLQWLDIDRRSIALGLNTPVMAGQAYQLWLHQPPADCAGNTMAWDSVLVGLPVFPRAGEVLINELLFNPLPGGSDMLEIYNHSQQLLDLSKLLLGNWDEELSAAVKLEPIVSQSQLFAPRSFLALTPNRAQLAEAYLLKQPDRVIEVERLPSMPDAEGSVALSTSHLIILDHLNYQAYWHSPLLKTEDGVSLERLSLTAPSQSADNWYSAASSAGFATPGYANSQRSEPGLSGDFSLKPSVFTPNHDGYHDQLQIHYRFEQPGSLLTLKVWSSDGLLMRTVQDRTMVGHEGFFTWDGTNARGQLMGSGIYIITAEIFHPDGQTTVLRRSCVLSL